VLLVYLPDELVQAFDLTQTILLKVRGRDHDSPGPVETPSCELPAHHEVEQDERRTREQQPGDNRPDHANRSKLE
jgi:hypothetical protein